MADARCSGGERFALSADDADSLWAFSLRVYSEPRVQQACLELQDRCGADVNLLLLIMWLAASGYTSTPPDIERFERVGAAWQERFIRPLRSLRRSWSAQVKQDDDPALRHLLRQLKELELQAERGEQIALVGVVASVVKSATDNVLEAAELGFGHYAKHIGAVFPSEHLASLLAALSDGRGGES